MKRILRISGVTLFAIAIVLTEATAQKTSSNLKLNFIRRVFIEALDGNSGPTARERLIVLLANSKRFEVVEDAKLADAIFKGRVDFEGQITTTTSGGPLKAKINTKETGTTLLRLSLSTGEIVWAWDDTKSCIRDTRTQCAVDDLLDASKSVALVGTWKSGVGGLFCDDGKIKVSATSDGRFVLSFESQKTLRSGSAQCSVVLTNITRNGNTFTGDGRRSLSVDDEAGKKTTASQQVSIELHLAEDDLMSIEGIAKPGKVDGPKSAAAAIDMLKSMTPGSGSTWPVSLHRIGVQVPEPISAPLPH